ncbi:phage head closure protein [Bacillus gobiensis]|uniref:phage head closure protein n=1 Tax=Bacillus gobiensis TaxID=1441095 RepID=UPI003D1E53D5
MIEAYEQFPHTITFLYQTSVSDGAGGWETGWKTYDTSEALVTPISSREFGQSSQTRNPIEYEVYYPYRTDIKPEMRIIYEEGETLTLAIKTRPMDQGGAQEVMMIECTYGDANG